MESLKFTAKGSKYLASGGRLHLIVAKPIACGKGVVLKEAYKKMNGRFFAQFIREHFNIAFARSGPKRNGKRLFIMDNDPSQRSKVAKRALEDIEAVHLRHLNNFATASSGLSRETSCRTY